MASSQKSKSFMDFWWHGVSATLTLALFKGQLYWKWIWIGLGVLVLSCFLIWISLFLSYVNSRIFVVVLVSFLTVPHPHGLHDLSFLTRGWTQSLRERMQSPNPCTTKEFPAEILLFTGFFKVLKPVLPKPIPFYPLLLLFFLYSLYTKDQDWWFLLESSVISASNDSYFWKCNDVFTLGKFLFEISIKQSPLGPRPEDLRHSAQRIPCCLHKEYPQHWASRWAG